MATAAKRRRAWIDRPFNGPGRCNWCGQVLDDSRCRWCSESCRDEFWCRASESYARELVEQRDHGICATCGIDARRQRAAFIRLCTWGEAGRWFCVRHYPRIAKQAQQKYSIPRGRLDDEWWDMDHIVPLVEGGSRGLSNLRTLCIPCHRDETRALAARRAQLRSGLRQTLTPSA